MKRVDPDKLYELLDRMMNPNRSGPIKIDLDAAFPKVAEPEQPKHDPYCMAGSVPCRKCRERAKAEQPPPSEPVIDEAVFEAAERVMDSVRDAIGKERRKCTGIESDVITAAIRKDRELRSNACGSESVGSSSDSSSTKSSAQQSARPAAPAADPRRLTADELAVSHRYGGLRGIANAQLGKAKVTISIDTLMAWSEHPDEGITDLIALLRRHGVEVVP